MDILAVATASFMLHTLKFAPDRTRLLLPLQLIPSPVRSPQRHGLVPRRARIFDVANPNRSTLLCL